MRALVSSNAEAREGQAPLGELLRPLVERGWDLDFIRTSSRQDAIKGLAARASEYDAILAAGGDGTVNAALQVAVTHNVALGAIPLGTANDFVRSLGGSLEPQEAVQELAESRECRIDVGVANGIYFNNAIGFGLGGSVTDELDGPTKARWGVFGYPVAVARAWREHEPFSVRLKSDESDDRFDALQVTIANGPHYGGGMTIDESSTNRDGLLDVQVIDPISFYRLAMSGPALRKGRGWEAPFVSSFVGPSFEISTDVVMDVSVDGDLLTQTPLLCKSLSRALRVLSCPVESGRED